jgi:hypothetical protein
MGGDGRRRGAIQVGEREKMSVRGSDEEGMSGGIRSIFRVVAGDYRRDNDRRWVDVDRSRRGRMVQVVRKEGEIGLEPNQLCRSFHRLYRLVESEERIGLKGGGGCG